MFIDLLCMMILNHNKLFPRINTEENQFEDDYKNVGEVAFVLCDPLVSDAFEMNTNESPIKLTKESTNYKSENNSEEEKKEF